MHQDSIDDKDKYCIVVDVFDLIFDAHVVFDLNKKVLVHDEYKEQIFPRHIVVNKSDKHNSIDEGYQQPVIFMVTEAEQQIYENNLHISYEKLEPVYGSIEKQAEVTIFSYQSSYFYDPVSIYMELCFSKYFSLVVFGIKSDDGCRYVLQIKFMLHIMNSSLISNCVERDLVNGLMLSWIHWKHDVT